MQVVLLSRVVVWCMGSFAKQGARIRERGEGRVDRKLQIEKCDMDVGDVVGDCGESHAKALRRKGL
jgi:hypothetical protein